MSDLITSPLIYDIERRKAGAWLIRAIGHLEMPADKPMDDDAFNAISLMLKNITEVAR